MHLSLLSEGYVSDSFDDAGTIAARPRAVTGPTHFAALCRGIIVVVALAVPIGMTLLATPAPIGFEQPKARAIAAHGMPLYPRDDG